jgi:hypothetical protein
MVKVIDTSEMLERLRAYKSSADNKIDIELLCVDLVILLKWTKHKPQELMNEIAYHWEKVHFDPTQKH